METSNVYQFSYHTRHFLLPPICDTLREFPLQTAHRTVHRLSGQAVNGTIHTALRNQA